MDIRRSQQRTLSVKVKLKTPTGSHQERLFERGCRGITDEAKFRLNFPRKASFEASI